MELQEKEDQKDEDDIAKLFRKNLQQRERFCKKRIRESSCARKENVVIDILITSRNGDRKIMQPIRITI